MHPPDSAAEQSFDLWAWVAFSVMAVCMSLSFVFTRISLDGFTLAQAAGGRLVIGAAFLVPMALIFGGGFPRERSFWAWAAAIGMISFVLPFALTTYAQLTLPSNVVGAMFTLIPLVTIALSAVILRVRISRRKLVGLVVGFLGLMIVTEPAKWVTQTGPEHALPMLAALTAVLCYAGAAIMMRLMPPAHPVALMGAAALMASLFGIIPFATVFDGELPPARPWIGLLGVSIMSTAIAYSLRFYLIRRKGPVFLAPNAYIGMILVNLFGVTILGDAITPAMLIAFPLIVVGLLIAQDGSGNMKQV